ncbi:histidine kinase [Nonomuraea sp. NPDC050643]|uniref:sensor histidine kinase n=1 Tax=Nonomuraea sp. NPDC050643 TaxID=3155660 RepID=UPI003404EDC1
MATEHTGRSGRLRRPLAALSRRRPLDALSRMSRLGDVPVVIMLAWAGWLAVPWSFSGLAQARAAAAAAAADAEPPRLQIPADTQPPLTDSGVQLLTGSGPGVGPAEPHRVPAQTQATAGGRHGTAAWGIPATQAIPFKTLRPCEPTPNEPASNAPAPCDPARFDPARFDPARFDPARFDPARFDSAVEAVARERARIAGEVHDVAGHGLAAIALQAGIALVTLDDDPEQARASLQAIKETSTAALAQLRAALDGIDPPGGGLPSLLDGIRAAGLPVDVEPAELTVPAHLRDTVYRVVRESLTNVLRHAGPTRALVRLTQNGQEFVLEVADRGAGPSDATGTVGAAGAADVSGGAEGRGLAGMRAKVTEAGGHLTAGPREGGGFHVIATFPQVPNAGAHVTAGFSQVPDGGAHVAAWPPQVSA